MVKNYVLDTNILLQNPDAVHGFEDNNIIVTGTVLQELDSKKTAPGELGYNAREAIRNLEKIRDEAGNIKKNGAYPIGKGFGKLIVEPDGISQDNLPNGYDISKPDNKIISTCVYLKKKAPRSKYILVSNDAAMRFSAAVIMGDDSV